jgi:hypothetical protein
MAELDTSAIRSALENQDYLTVIDEVRSAIAADPLRAVQDPVIGDWMCRRYRNLFVQEAVQDAKAVKESGSPFPLNVVDKRSDDVKVAVRYFKRLDPEELGVQMPEAQVGSMANTTFVFAPGLITGLLPSLGFQSVWPRLKKRFGINILAVDAHPMASGEANSQDVVNLLEKGTGTAPDERGSYITEADNPTPPGDVVIMGYSKGSVDTLTMLKNRPDLAPRVKAFIGWAGAIGGSYSADDIYEKVKDLNQLDALNDLHGSVGKLLLQLVPIIQVERVNRRIPEYDIKGAIQSLTTWYREEFNKEHWDYFSELGVPMMYFSGSATIFDVPWFQRQATWDLAKIDPLNDMQVTQAQTRPPIENPPHLALFRANHWDLSYDTFPWFTTMGSQHLKNPFPRESAMAALMLFLSEVGLIT